MEETNGLTKAEVVSLNTIIQEKIKEYIRKNNLSPGDKLPTETELGKRIGVSRTAIREALRGLEAIGIIEVQHGSGRYIKDFDLSNLLGGLTYSLVLESESLLDLLEVRAALEGSFIFQAVSLIHEDDLEELKRIIIRIEEKIKEKKSFAQEDMEFHLVLFRRVNNKILKQLLDIFWRLFSESLSENLKLSAQDDIVLHHHKELLEAVCARNTSKAALMLKNHFSEVRERLKKLNHFS